MICLRKKCHCSAQKNTSKIPERRDAVGVGVKEDDYLCAVRSDAIFKPSPKQNYSRPVCKFVLYCAPCQPRCVFPRQLHACKICGITSIKCKRKLLGAVARLLVLIWSPGSKIKLPNAGASFCLATVPLIYQAAQRRAHYKQSCFT
jgi:hypothetical protein